LNSWVSTAIEPHFVGILPQRDPLTSVGQGCFSKESFADVKLFQEFTSRSCLRIFSPNFILVPFLCGSLIVELKRACNTTDIWHFDSTKKDPYKRKRQNRHMAFCPSCLTVPFSFVGVFFVCRGLFHVAVPEVSSCNRRDLLIYAVGEYKLCRAYTWLPPPEFFLEFFSFQSLSKSLLSSKLVEQTYRAYTWVPLQELATRFLRKLENLVIKSCSFRKKRSRCIQLFEILVLLADFSREVRKCLAVAF